MYDIKEAELSWEEFEKSGKIADYLKYKDIKEIDFSNRESEPIGNP